MSWLTVVYILVYAVAAPHEENIAFCVSGCISPNKQDARNAKILQFMHIIKTSTSALKRSSSNKHIFLKKWFLGEKIRVREDVRRRWGLDIRYGDQLHRLCCAVQAWATRSRDTARSSSLRSMKSSWTTRSHTASGLTHLTNFRYFNSFYCRQRWKTNWSTMIQTAFRPKTGEERFSFAGP